MVTLKERSKEKEIFDVETPPAAETFQAYRLIELVNRHLGGLRATLFHLKKFSALRKPDAPVELLDIGTGGCDIPRAIVSWARKRGLPVRITAVDTSREALQFAKRKNASYPEICLVQGDAFRLPFKLQSFDYVISSLFFHHLGDEEIPGVLLIMDALARRGILINDLLRRRRAYVWIKLFTLFTRNRPFRKDAPLSVLRGFKEKEVLEAVKASGLPYLKFHERFGHRFVLAGEKRETPEAFDQYTPAGIER